MKNLFLATLSKAINSYLGLDPESKKRLQHLQGKVVTIELLPLHLVFQLLVTDQSIEVKENEHLLANTKISGTPIQMLGMMLNKTDRQHFFADDMKIEGDAELGQNIVALFDELHIDWEEYLSRFIGDVPAYHAGRFVSNIGKWLRGTEKSLSENINEYVHEEVHWFPNSEALKDFYNDIDNLRMDLDRMEARIAQLKAAIFAQEND